MGFVDFGAFDLTVVFFLPTNPCFGLANLIDSAFGLWATPVIPVDLIVSIALAFCFTKPLVTVGALGALALVAEPLLQLAGVFGGDGEGGGDDTSQIVEKLDQLIAVVEAGGDVIMDGNKVGRTLTLVSSQIG